MKWPHGECVAEINAKPRHILSMRYTYIHFLRWCVHFSFSFTQTPFTCFIRAIAQLSVKHFCINAYFSQFHIQHVNVDCILSPPAAAVICGLLLLLSRLDILFTYVVHSYAVIACSFLAKQQRGLKSDATIHTDTHKPTWPHAHTIQYYWMRFHFSFFVVWF